MTKPVILTGIRANNDLQIGNYFGALLPMIEMAKQRADEYQVNLFVPDLHSFTTPIDHSQLYGQIMHNLKLFVAAGLPLDNPDIHIYRQSYIPAHSELTWILDCFTGFGEMSRMTQFKDKSGKLEEDRISVGLFNYPVLMAADILLYGATYVPVGEDQTQHLEFTRAIAMRMNARFGNLFTVPKPVKEQHEFFGKDQGLRIRNLVIPTQKMGKSDDEQRGVIFLSEDPESAAKKVMGATTDSVGAVHFDRETQPGISNLLQILALLQQKPLKEVTDAYEGKTSYGELKKDVADHVRTFLTEFQARLASVDETALQAKLEQSELAMRGIANKTLARVQRAVGLRQKVKPEEADVDIYSNVLSEMGIENEIFKHPSSRKIDDVIASLHLQLSDTLPTLVAKGKDRYIALIARGGRKIDFEKAKVALGLSELHMATADEFVQRTGLPAGAARVYIPDMETIVDNSVFEREYLMGGSGRFDCSIRYRTEDLKKIPGVRILDIAA